MLDFQLFDLNSNALVQAA